MKPFNEYFTAEEIIRQLCKVRVQNAESRNDQQYVARLGGHQRINQIRGEVDVLRADGCADGAYAQRLRVAQGDVTAAAAGIQGADRIDA